MSDTDGCIADCRAHLSVVAAASYAKCAEELRCADVIASLSMNEGPLGLCYVRALQTQ